MGSNNINDNNNSMGIIERGYVMYKYQMKPVEAVVFDYIMHERSVTIKEVAEHFNQSEEIIKTVINAINDDDSHEWGVDYDGVFLSV